MISPPDPLADMMADFSYDNEATSFTRLPLRPASGPVPTTAASSQSMIDLLTGFLQGNADNITLSKAQALDLVQCLRGPTEGNAQPESNREQQLEQDLKQMHADSRLGDYAGRVFNDLKDAVSNRSLLGRADELVRNLDEVPPTTKTCVQARKDLEAAVRNLGQLPTYRYRYGRVRSKGMLFAKQSLPFAIGAA